MSERGERGNTDVRELERTLRSGGRKQRGITRSDEPPDAPDQPATRLALQLDDGREVAISGRVTIGSAPDNDLVLADDFVSGWHCVVQPLGRRVVVVDCGSRNGTFVAGARVGSCELAPGTRLTIGRTGMRVTGEAAPDEGELLGRSPVMRKLRETIAQLGPTRATVLLLGESGTGKELCARALHAASGRPGAFVALNCGAISPELVESELFGHERGAFTGANAKRAGLFAEADGGTLFLDEVAELPTGLQPKLLRVLETGGVRPVGGAGERKVDVRVVAATHQDLKALVKARSFRLDLYHRLATVEVMVPSLRERRGDVELLARHFLDEAAAVSGPKVLSPAAREAIVEYGWPGNVRELRNAIQRAAILGGAVIEPGDLRIDEDDAATAAGDAVAIEGRSMEELERDAIEAALKRAGGSRRAAAAALKMPKSTLCDKVRRYGLDKDLPPKGR
jgi:DNA-binding NtrC family response regulator